MLSTLAFILGVFAGSLAVAQVEVNGWPWWRALLIGVFVCWLTAAVVILVGGLL